MPVLCIGDVISDPCGNSYRLVRDLGIGSFGLVYLARHVASGRPFALKCICKTALTPGELEQQRMEAKLHDQAGQHPNIVAFHSSFESTDWLFLVLEYCAGSDLYDWIVEQDMIAVLDTPGMVAAEADQLTKQISGVFIQVLRAVAHIHERGIYHCDLKPENFLTAVRPDCTSDDCVPIVKLCDFGLATAETCSTDYGRGSYPYMSVECRGSSIGSDSKKYYRDSGVASLSHKLSDYSDCAPYSSAGNDVWALGAILVNLFYGVQLWSEADPSDHNYASFLRDGAGFIERRCFGSASTLSNPVIADFLTMRIFCPQDERCTVNEFLEWAEQTLIDGRNVYNLSDTARAVAVPTIQSRPVATSAAGNSDSSSSHSLSKTLVDSLPSLADLTLFKLTQPCTFSWADMDDDDFDAAAVLANLSFGNSGLAQPPVPFSTLA